MYKFTLLPIICVAGMALTGCGSSSGTSINSDAIKNIAPIANAGNDVYTSLQQSITLSARYSSDINGDKLIYAWSLIDKPIDSAFTLANPASSEITIKPDAHGEYQFRLIVNDGTTNSQADVVSVVVSNNRHI